jgi:PAS domain S-box-containing protein
MREEIVSQQHIQASEKAFLVKLVALCPDGVIAINRSGLITIFNRAAEVLTGHSAEETIGKKNIIDIYPSSDIAREIKKHLYSDTYGDKGYLEGYGFEIKTQAGQTIPIRLSAALIYNNNEETGSVGFFHDMSPQKEIEKKLRRLSSVLTWIISKPVTTSWGTWKGTTFYESLGSCFWTSFENLIRLIDMAVTSFSFFCPRLNYKMQSEPVKKSGQASMTTGHMMWPIKTLTLNQ